MFWYIVASEILSVFAPSIGIRNNLLFIIFVFAFDISNMDQTNLGQTTNMRNVIDYITDIITDVLNNEKYLDKRYIIETNGDK